MSHPRANGRHAATKGNGAHAAGPPEPGPGDPASVAIRAALGRGGQRLREWGPKALAGVVEGVHRMRTSTRRLRSELRAFRELIDSEWLDPLEDELNWLAEVLGVVRDLDVLEERLRKSAAESSDALGPLFDVLHDDHARASESLRAALLGDRYRTLLDRLEPARVVAALKDDAKEKCRSALPALLAESWKGLKTRARDLGPDDSDDEFHKVRIRAKRARDAAESFAEALDKPRARKAKEFAKHVGALKDVLGEQHDAVVAGQQIERVVAGHPADGPFNLAAGRLLERQACAESRARDAFFDAWEKLDRKKNARWLKT